MLATHGRRLALTGLLVPAVVACGAVPFLAPRDTSRIPEVGRWTSDSTSEIVEGDLVMRFEGWPAPTPPVVSICSEDPAAIWAPDGSGPAFPDDPVCSGPLATELDGGVLRIRLDPDVLLPRFGHLETWKRVMAYEDSGGRWSASSDLPAALVRTAD